MHTESKVRTLVTENLRTLREKSGLSMRQLAEHLGVHKGTISRWETDTENYRFPDPDSLQQLADFYQVQISELFKPQGYARRGLEVRPDLSTALLIVNRHMSELTLIRKKKPR